MQAATTEAVGSIDGHQHDDFHAISEIAAAIASAVEQQGAATQGDRTQRAAGRAGH